MKSPRLKFRGNGCDPKASAAMLRHFFALDAQIGKAIADFSRANRRSKSAKHAASVARSFRDFACLCVAEKCAGRDTKVFTMAKPAALVICEERKS